MRFIVLASLLLALPAWAGYRVYELELTHYDRSGKKVERKQLIRTNLDPYQYDQYHRPTFRYEVKMKSTWFCPGDTSYYREYCDPPKVKNRAPSSWADPKRPAIPYNLQPVIP